jgi:hypothetical protein
VKARETEGRALGLTGVDLASYVHGPTPPAAWVNRWRRSESGKVVWLKDGGLLAWLRPVGSRWRLNLRGLGDAGQPLPYRDRTYRSEGLALAQCWLEMRAQEMAAELHATTRAEQERKEQIQKTWAGMTPEVRRWYAEREIPPEDS